MARQSLKSDPALRQRMIDAQRAESEALAAVCEALQRVDREVGRQRKLVEQWDARVEELQRQAGEAAATLVAGSGTDRAAALLDISKRELTSLMRRQSSEPDPSDQLAERGRKATRAQAD